MSAKYDCVVDECNLNRILESARFHVLIKSRELGKDFVEYRLDTVSESRECCILRAKELAKHLETDGVLETVCVVFRQHQKPCFITWE